MEEYYGGGPSYTIPPLFSEEEIVIRVNVDRLRSPIDSILGSIKNLRIQDFNIDPRSLISVPLGGDKIVDVVFFKYDENKTEELDYCQPYINSAKEKYGEDVFIWFPNGCNVAQMDFEMKKRNLVYDPIAIMMAYESGLENPEKMRSTTIWKTSVNGGHFLSYNHDQNPGVLMKPILDWDNSRGREMGCYMWYAGVRKI